MINTFALQRFTLLAQPRRPFTVPIRLLIRAYLLSQVENVFSISALLVTKESLGEIRDQAVGVRIATSAEWLAGAKLKLVLERINQVERTLDLDYEAVLRDGAAQLCKQGYLSQEIAGDFRCMPSFFDLLTELGLSTLNPKTQE